MINIGEFNIWHPFTHLKNSPAPLKVKSGKGIYIELENGEKLIDCISSWWVNIHGHSHPRIAKAIYEQALKLEHVIFSGFTHSPAQDLVKELEQIVPPSLNHVFFSDNGSTSVEVALKIVCQYWKNLNQMNKNLFICFDGSYHGDTFGAMSVGAKSIFNQAFDPLLFEVKSIPYPSTFLNDVEVEEKEKHSLNQLELLLNNNNNVAGVIIEPLVQGAGGMKMCRDEFLKQLKSLTMEKNIPLIFDEVMTGFGRTGDWFAMSKSNVTPDLVCVSKGISGGFLPLALTLCNQNIYQTFYSDDPKKTFYHGHSYTGNPLSCAASIESLKMLKENPGMFRNLEATHNLELQKLIHKYSHLIQKGRICGTIMAFDIKTENRSGYLNQVGMKIREKGMKLGLLIRPLGDTLYLLPPFCITQEELTQIYQKIDLILESFDF